MNHPDHCNFNLFWHTSLACTAEKDDASKSSATVKDSCVVKVPGFDQKLDLKALRDAKFYTAHSGKYNSYHFLCFVIVAHLNLPYV